jgi:hypothetical protein
MHFFDPMWHPALRVLTGVRPGEGAEGVGGGGWGRGV